MQQLIYELWQRISPLNQWGLSQVVAEFWLTSAVNHVMENLPENLPDVSSGKSLPDV